MIIHFFKNRAKDRIDFSQLIDDYFDLIENSQIESTDDEVKITINLPQFGCEYYYFITKRSRVSSVYKLNSDFININLLCDIPEVLPQYVMRVILRQIEELCSKFDLAIYHDQIDNIKDFKLFEILQCLIRNRTKYLEEHTNEVYYHIPEHMLNQVCLYQQIVDRLPSLVNNDIVPCSYITLIDKKTRDVQFAINWKIEQPIIFPPELSYVQVEEEENLIALIPANIFFKYVTRFTYEIKEKTVDLKMMYLDEKGCKKVKKLMKKLKKHMVSISSFDIISLPNLIEE